MIFKSSSCNLFLWNWASSCCLLVVPAVFWCWILLPCRQKQHMTQLEQRLRESELQVHGALLGRGTSFGDICMLRLQVSGTTLWIPKPTLTLCWLLSPWRAPQTLLFRRRLRGRMHSWGLSSVSAPTVLPWRKQRQNAGWGRSRRRRGAWRRVWRRPARGTQRKWRNRKRGFVLTQHTWPKLNVASWRTTKLQQREKADF